MLTIVRQSIEARALLPRASHVLIACSGGPDSTVLLHVLCALRAELDLRLSVASVDHRLRAEAQDEIALVQRHAEQLGVPFYKLSIEIAGKHNLQEHARERRYAALLALAKRLGAEFTAVGHCQDDQAETVLDRLLRGSGITGLQGIIPLRPDGIVRPLIDVPRSSIRQYVRAQGLLVAEDPSNHNPRFRRVRIRNQLLPMLLSEQPQLVRHLAALADDAALLEPYCEAQAALHLRTVRRGRDLDWVAMKGSPEALWHRMWTQWIQSETASTVHLGRQHVEELRQLLTTGQGCVWLPGRMQVTVRQNRMVLGPQPSRTSSKKDMFPVR